MYCRQRSLTIKKIIAAIYSYNYFSKIQIPRTQKCKEVYQYYIISSNKHNMENKAHKVHACTSIVYFLWGFWRMASQRSDVPGRERNLCITSPASGCVAETWLWQMRSEGKLKFQDTTSESLLQFRQLLRLWMWAKSARTSHYHVRNTYIYEQEER